MCITFYKNIVHLHVICIYIYACIYFGKIDQLQSTVSAIHTNASSGYKRVYEQPCDTYFLLWKVVRSQTCTLRIHSAHVVI